MSNFDCKYHEKKEFQNFKVGGKQLENLCLCQFSNKYDFIQFCICAVVGVSKIQDSMAKFYIEPFLRAVIII